MARIADTDFERLKDFIGSYSLKHVADTPEKLGVVKNAHKTYLPFLQLWSICSEKEKTNEFNFFLKEVNKDSQEFAHFRESISDVSSGLFCCLHGAYKPGHMALRSCIENFLRFSVGIFNKAALTTTSVYELFEFAKEVEPLNKAKSSYINKLQNCYSELCKYTHSASLAHMSGIHALAHFPSFNDAEFKKWLNLARQCMEIMVTIITLGCPTIYLSAHYTAKELLDILFLPKERLLLLKGG
ncbi:hypothetical protein [Iodobacter ciconiae]|uniref:Uncharacterized protein n=1 Tax=Iodobacter ciconiae TaxID=2496266 RepID=A0A3S8ZQV8_9NEIS|nr:hypothetical protein [Iodobacter ciconiae]AZN35866.1 hypothetical protein EJO50_04835 [Iodobacter ciconiae]